MENWGAILSKESNAKFDYYVGGGDSTAQIYYVNTHEISHQWIGNLVTPKSWNDLWLSEGLAVQLTDNFLEQKFPALRLGLQQYSIKEGLRTAEIAKQSQSLQSNKAASYSEDNDIAAILYGKGGAVFSMMEQALGRDKWRDVLRSYIAQNKGKSVSTDDLISAVRALKDEKAARTLTDFAKQPGFPLISIDKAICQDGKTLLSLSQRPYPGATASANPAVKIWTIPVFVATAQQRQITYIDQTQQNISVAGCGAFTLNADASGYYGVDYQKLAGNALFADFGRLSATDQYGVLTQSFGNADSAVASFGPAFELLARANIATLPELSNLAVNKLILVRRAFSGEKDKKYRNKLDDKIRKLLSPALVLLEPVSGANDVAARAMRQLLDIAGDPSIKANPNVAIPDKEDSSGLFFRPEAADYARVAFRNMDATRWQKYVDGLDKKSIVGLDAYIAINKNPVIIKKALLYALTGDMEPYNRSTIFKSAADEWPSLVLDRLLSDPRVRAKLSAEEVADIATSTAAQINDARDIDRLSRYANSLDDGIMKLGLFDAIKASRIRIANFAKMRADLKTWIVSQN
jgi:Peptidase family M1 domain